MPFGSREKAKCPECHSLERHRSSWLYLKNKTDLFVAKKRLLHIAPEKSLSGGFEKLGLQNYISVDLNNKATLQMDITSMSFADASFDYIYCSHVLEHVRDDIIAMREFYRVLSSGGVAIVIVPIYADSTYEDPSVTTVEGRKEAFGQHDHVRIYGPDIKNRLKDVGFKVNFVRTRDFLGEDEIARYGLRSHEHLFHCLKEL